MKKIILQFDLKEFSRDEIMQNLALKHRPTFLYNYLQPALSLNLIEMTIPDKPNSRIQKYRLTALGKEWKKKL